jgi:hypothetical protein
VADKPSELAGSFEVAAASFQSIDELMLLALLSLCQMLRKMHQDG